MLTPGQNDRAQSESHHQPQTPPQAHEPIELAREQLAAPAPNPATQDPQHNATELVHLGDPNGPSLSELWQQAWSSTVGGYDLLASKFDHTPFCTPQFLLEKVAPFIGAPRSIGAGLDVCCGTGAGLQMLEPLCRERVTGIDFSTGMLESAKAKFASVKTPVQLEFVHGDALRMPFKEEFDVAVSFGAFGHILRGDQARFAEQVHNALKPGGRFVFVTMEMPSPLSPNYWAAKAFNAAMHVRNMIKSPPFHMYYLNFHLEEARTVLEKAGFEVKAHKNVFDGILRPCVVVEARKQ